MKKFLFLFTLLLCLTLSSGVQANHSCVVDDYGCYIMDNENQTSYLMFWSEEARLAIMGNLSAPYENVVPKPHPVDISDGNTFAFYNAAATDGDGCGEEQFIEGFIQYMVTSQGESKSNAEYLLSVWQTTPAAHPHYYGCAIPKYCANTLTSMDTNGWTSLFADCDL